jgi:hypothetical protein
VLVDVRTLDPRWLTSAAELLVPCPGGPPTAPGSVFVCLPDDAQCLEVADRVLTLLQAHRVTVVATVTHDRVIGRHDGPARTRGAAALHLLNQTQSVFSLNAMCTGLDDRLARAIHDEYVAVCAKAGDTVTINPSMVEWSRPPEHLRASNLDQAADVGRKLAAIDRIVVPLSELPSAADERAAAFTQVEVETLAKLEHQRWTAERKRQGWTFGRERDDDRRTHPDLQDWSLLDETAREKDRNAVRAIPRILRAAGFAVVRRR